MEPNNEGAVVVSRKFITDNSTTDFKFFVVDGHSVMGKALVNALHVHCMSEVRQHSKALDAGFYIVHGTSMWKKLNKECITCRRIRKFTVHPPLGDSLLLEAVKGNRYEVVTIDVFGYLKAKVGRSTQKVYILTVSCHATLHTTFSIMHDNSADSLLSAFQRCLHNVAATCRICVSDSGSNILTIRDLGLNHTESEADLQIEQIGSVMRAAGISFRSSVSSPWRSTRAEKAHHLLKMALRRSDLSKNHAYSMESWYHIASVMSRTINDRPLSLSTIDSQLTSVTPNKLLYGNNVNQLNLDLSGRPRLYSRLIQLERDLAAWKNIFIHSYVREQLQYLKRLQGTDPAMDKDSVVLVTDFPHKITKYPVLGQVSEVLSDRTYKVQYVKTEPETKWVAGRLKITKPAVTGELIRPAQRLVFLFNPHDMNDEDEEVIIDPILGHQGAQPNIVQGPLAPLAMNFVADADASDIRDV